MHKKTKTLILQPNHSKSIIKSFNLSIPPAMKHRIVPLLLLLIATASYASQTYCIDIQTKELCPVDFMIEPTITAKTEDDGITVTYEIPHAIVKPNTGINGAYWWEFPNFGTIHEEGYPALPIRIDSFELPFGCDSTQIVVTQTSCSNLDIEIAPAREPTHEPMSEQDTYSHTQTQIKHNVNVTPSSIATLIGIGQQRGRKIANVRILPTGYNHSSKRLDVYNRFTYRILFLKNGQPITVSQINETSGNKPSKAIGIESGSITLPTEPTNEHFLILSVKTHENSLKEFKRLKKMQGFNVDICYSNRWSPQSIKDSIASYYAKYNLTHVLIVGSHSEVPGERIENTESFSDYHYSCIEPKKAYDLPDV